MASARADVLSGEGKVDRQAYRPRRSRIHGRTSLRSVGIAPPLRAADETGNARDASPTRQACPRARLAHQPFVCVRFPMGAVAGADSELVRLEGWAGCVPPLRAVC